jgi:hypothetical protein
MTVYRLLKEAKQAYSMCVKIDPKNINMLKDLSAIQITLKDWAGLKETRRQYMLEQP